MRSTSTISIGRLLMVGAALVGGVIAATSLTGNAAPAGAQGPAVVDFQSIGGSGTPLKDGSQDLDRLEALRQHGVIVLPGTVKGVEAPHPETGTWIVSAQANEGVCLTLPDLSLCGDEADRQAGRLATTIYPADRIEDSLDPRNRVIPIEASTGPGVRRGVAPRGATRVEVISAYGGVLESATVDRGLYVIDVPNQQTPAALRFSTGANSIVADGVALP